MKYTSFNIDLYTGRYEPFENQLASYYYQHIHPYHNQPICLLGFACDQGVNRNQGRIGAKHAPDIIKSAFGKLPIAWQIQQQYPDLEHLIGDWGNIVCDDNDKIVDNLLESTQENYANAICQIIHNNSLPIAIGGGHEIAFGSFMGLYNALNQNNNHPKTNKTIGIINIDAHFDLRDDKYATSGTPFRQISQFLQNNHEPFYYLTVGINEFANTAALFAKAQKLGVHIISENECYDLSFNNLLTKINTFMNQVDVVYLTVDLDVLQAAFMPAVSAVNAKGLSLDLLEKYISHIIKSGKVKIIDIAEFNPNFDIDGHGAKVAGRLVAWIMMCLFNSGYLNNNQ